MRTWACGVVMLGMIGCVGTSTGNPVVPGDSEPDDSNSQGGQPTLGGERAHCNRDETVLASVDAATPLGFTAADVLSYAAGVHETAIRWQESEIASYGPESGEHALTLRVTHGSGQVRLIEYRDKPSSGESGGALGWAPCTGAAIEIDVEVEITTSGGALDERASATLHAASRNWARLYVPLEPDELGGAFAVTETRPSGFTLAQLHVDIGLSPLGVRGELNGVLEMRSSTAATAAGFGSFAYIGAAAGCEEAGLPIGLDEPLDGVTGEDAIAAVNEASGLSARWRDGATTSVALQLTHDGEAVCAVLAPAAPYDPVEHGSLHIRGTLQAASDDGRLDAEWPVIVQAALDAQGELDAIGIGFDMARLPQATADTLAAYGLPGVDARGYDGVQVSLRLALEQAGGGMGSPSGQLIVQGFTLPDCSAEPAPDPLPADGSGSGGRAAGGSAGCPGAEFVELESLSFSP